MSPNDSPSVQVTLVLSPREFETAMMFGEEALSILMDGGIIPHGETSSSDPVVRKDLATFGLQELIANWTYRAVLQPNLHPVDDDDEIPF